MDKISSKENFKETSACGFNMTSSMGPPHFPTLVEPLLKLVNSFLCLFGQSFPDQE